MSPRTTVTTLVDGRELVLSNLDKVLFPATGFTKGQVIDYYARIAPVMVPHLYDRPLTMKRWPDGVDGQFFFEKHAPRHAPDWVRSVTVPSSGKGDPVTYSVICDLPALVWAANLASIEFHVPLWHVGRRRKLPAAPDHMVFDLDPGEGATIVECCQVALLIRDELASRVEPIHAKTSGSKGMQLYTPLSKTLTWERLRDDAHGYAAEIERAASELVVSNMRKSLRGGKVLIDWSQNSPSKTTIAVYSLRGRSLPRVSTPVTWEEVAVCAAGGETAQLSFSPEDTLARVDELGDLFLPATT